VSFTQNLFLLAVELRKQQSNFVLEIPKLPNDWIKWLLVYLFFGALSLAPRFAETDNIILVLLATRIILFAPYLNSRPSVIPERSAAGDKAVSSQDRLLLLAIFGLTFGWATYLVYRCDYPPGAIWSALHDSPAVSALGYDFLLGITSLAVIKVLD
jgi:hypothetical protein